MSAPLQPLATTLAQSLLQPLGVNLIWPQNMPWMILHFNTSWTNSVSTCLAHLIRASICYFVIPPSGFQLFFIFFLVLHLDLWHSEIHGCRPLGLSFQTEHNLYLILTEQFHMQVQVKAVVIQASKASKLYFKGLLQVLYVIA